MICENPFGPGFEPLDLPEHTAILTMREHVPLPDPRSAIESALRHPTAGPGLYALATAKKRQKPLDQLKVSYIADGPYAVLFPKEEKA